MNYKEKRKLYKDNERLKVFNLFSGRCAYCGCDLSEMFTVDHVKPLKRKSKLFSSLVYSEYELLPEEIKIGGDDIDNMFPACMSCNCSKSDSSLDSFRDKILYRILNKRKKDKVVDRFSRLVEGEFLFFYFEKQLNQKEEHGQEG